MAAGDKWYGVMQLHRSLKVCGEVIDFHDGYGCLPCFKDRTEAEEIANGKAEILIFIEEEASSNEDVRHRSEKKASVWSRRMLQKGKASKRGRLPDSN